MFLDSNALGLTVAALSSYDPHMRAAAYHVLVAYYSHLEGARFPEQSQLLYLLDVVREGIRTQNMRLTFTVALFIAKAALLILKPGTTDRIGSGRAWNTESEQVHVWMLNLQVRLSHLCKRLPQGHPVLVTVNNWEPLGCSPVSVVVRKLCMGPYVIKSRKI